MNILKPGIQFHALALFGLVWEIVSRLNIINPLYISSPSDIFLNLGELILSKQIFTHLYISLLEIFLGLLFAIILGLIVGITTGWNRKIDKVTSPFIYGLYSTPYIALIPLVIIWTGLGILPKIIIIFIGAFLPITVNTTEGIKSLDKDYIKLGRSLNASTLQIIEKIALPFALPFILAGIKQAIPRSVVAMVASEFFASSKGLGYLIFYYGGTFQTGKLLSIVFLLIAISLVLTQILQYSEKKLLYKK